MLEVNFHPFPVLETERLILRNLSKSDAEDMYRMKTDIAAMKYLDRAMPKSMGDIDILMKKIWDNLEQNNGINWILEYKETGRFVGTISFHRIEKENYRAEIGYQMMPEYWGKGIMQEAITRVIEYGFNTLKFHSIEAIVNPANEASVKLLLKNGFVKEGHFKENHFFNGKFMDTGVYSLLRG